MQLISDTAEAYAKALAKSNVIGERVIEARKLRHDPILQDEKYLERLISKLENDQVQLNLQESRLKSAMIQEIGQSMNFAPIAKREREIRGELAQIRKSDLISKAHHHTANQTKSSIMRESYRQQLEIDPDNKKLQKNLQQVDYDYRKASESLKVLKLLSTVEGIPVMDFNKEIDEIRHNTFKQAMINAYDSPDLKSDDPDVVSDMYQHIGIIGNEAMMHGLDPLALSEEARSYLSKPTEHSIDGVNQLRKSLTDGNDFAKAIMAVKENIARDGVKMSDIVLSLDNTEQEQFREQYRLHRAMEKSIENISFTSEMNH
tara:strand:- start:970 stop:1920 length:951 start_codon:yes stop_codon:yes gene_type:complete